MVRADFASSANRTTLFSFFLFLFSCAVVHLARFAFALCFRFTADRHFDRQRVPGVLSVTGGVLYTICIQTTHKKKKQTNEGVEFRVVGIFRRIHSFLARVESCFVDIKSFSYLLGLKGFAFCWSVLLVCLTSTSPFLTVNLERAVNPIPFPGN